MKKRNNLIRVIDLDRRVIRLSNGKSFTISFDTTKQKLQLLDNDRKEAYSIPYNWSESLDTNLWRLVDLIYIAHFSK